MKSRPILFSGPMVRAILEGSKTQTRRVVKRTDTGRVKAVGSHKNWHIEDPNSVLACPYGEPGDQLWVKETFWFSEYCSPHSKPCKEAIGEGWGILYAATDDMNSPNRPIKKTEERLRPSIFMPRWASRITLEITDVRVERLQEIGEEDAYQEGVSTYCPFNLCNGGGLISADQECRCADLTPMESYKFLWESINGPGSWKQNPFVWVLTFKRI